MKRYSTALFIGRFQPFHNGHLYSLHKCLEIAERVIVGIGSSNVSGTDNNPWDYEARKRMIESLDLGERVEIVPVPDTPTDEEWTEFVKEKVIKFFKIKNEEIVIVSNNEWVTNLMRDAGYEIYETGLYNRDELEGVKIRKLMRDGDPEWKKRLPQEILKFIEIGTLPSRNGAWPDRRGRGQGK